MVWFGEAVPALEQAVPRVAQADLVFVVGTSLQVYPANSLVQFARPEARLVVVDPHAPAVDHPRLTVVREAASTGLPKAIAAASISVAARAITPSAASTSLNAKVKDTLKISRGSSAGRRSVSGLLFKQFPKPH